MEQWEIERSEGRCSKTGRELAEGEEYYAVLFEDGQSFRREDYAPEVWDGPPPGAYCFFKTRMPVKTRKKRLLVDDALLIDFFHRLADEDEPVRLRFRFVLALILMRKRLLKYEETVREVEAEWWWLRQVREGTMHKVLNPQLTDDQIEGVSHELGAILHGDVRGEWVLDQEEQDG